MKADSIRRFLVLAALCLSTLLPAVPVAAETEPAAGMFLVADESIADPRFERSVILLLSHDEKGAVGLMVNRPTRIRLSHVLQGTDDLERLPETVHFGGPVGLPSMLVLIRGESPPQPSRQILNELFVTGVEEAQRWLETSFGPEDRLHVYMGYAGWAPGQLGKEIARGDWHLRPGESDAVFAPDPGELWPRLRQKEKPVWVLLGSAESRGSG